MRLRRKIGIATAVVVCLGAMVAGQAFGYAWTNSVTGRFAAWADPGSSTVRVACANKHGTTQHREGSGGWEMSGRTRTYDGTFPNCPNPLGQAAGAMHVRARAFRWNPSTGSNELIFQTALGTNVALGSVADVADTNPWKPKGTYQHYVGHDWTAWGNYAHYESEPTAPGWVYYCNWYVGHSC